MTRAERIEAALRHQTLRTHPFDPRLCSACEDAEKALAPSEPSPGGAACKECGRKGVKYGHDCEACGGTRRGSDHD